MECQFIQQWLLFLLFWSGWQGKGGDFSNLPQPVLSEVVASRKFSNFQRTVVLKQIEKTKAPTKGDSME